MMAEMGVPREVITPPRQYAPKEAIRGMCIHALTQTMQNGSMGGTMQKEPEMVTARVQRDVTTSSYVTPARLTTGIPMQTPPSNQWHSIVNRL